MIYDNLSRDGVDQNLQWLKKTYGKNLLVQIADINENRILEESVKQAQEVFHFSAQVAVTTSLYNPALDYQVNLGGTFQLLEAIRKSGHKPPLFYTSTNKVYGNLGDIQMKTNATRYYPLEKEVEEYGINETQVLDFHSPYGCSKGAADQYVLDYSRSFGLKTIVFRMSCIYGPHQFGTEDQGWVAHFLISALNNRPIIIYGNGKQVRDILYVEDLIDAFLLAGNNMSQLAGEVFNIGGGPANSVSLLEILNLIKQQSGKELNLSFEKWRTGDQSYYVSDISKFRNATGWNPKFTVEKGMQSLLRWFTESRDNIKNKNSSIKAIAL